jgi:geranylgeranyl diphosphate synthase type I
MSDIDGLRTEVNHALSEFVSTQGRYLISIGEELEPVAIALEKFLLESGKRLRPLFAYVGMVGAGIKPSKDLISAAASLELLHVCALIHDDVMDASDTRRGAPSIHKTFEKMHLDKKMVGNSSQFGIASAILIGDLALIWSAQMLHNSTIPTEKLISALPVYDEMRVELMSGQYLDVYEQSLGTESIERSMKVARYKSGKYTIERPLHFGAALAQAPNDLFKTYTKYGIPLGEAFQLRDDLLGVFGDPTQTGKPAGDDLREGKRTALIAIALKKASDSQRKLIKDKLGDSNLTSSMISDLQQAITDSGATNHIETMIEELTNTSLSALNHDGISPDGKRYLTELAVLATNRKI